NASADLQPCGNEAGSALDERGAPLWLSSDDLMRRAIHTEPLTFPMLGHGHLQGAVRLDIRIDERGNVECAHAVNGDPIAISSAMTAIHVWRFRPFVHGGKAIPVHGHLTIKYDVAR
ncbi:MAG: energy transducer TonB, partial [Acidobacteriota bacterium]